MRIDNTLGFPISSHEVTSVLAGSDREMTA
jgi:hypothetical protein